MSIAILEKCIDNVMDVESHMDEVAREKLSLLVKDLEEAMMTIFIKTADAKPFLERCLKASQIVKEVVEKNGCWNEDTQKVFAKFDKAVSKLHSTIMVRTQRAT
jgi:hypothetical protein